MRTLFICLVGCMVALGMCSAIAVVDAAVDVPIYNEIDDFVYLVEFKSLKEMENYIAEHRENDSFIDDELGDYLSKAQYLYIPKEFETKKIHRILVTPTYAEVQYKAKDVYFWFMHYFDEIAGQLKYEDAQHILETNPKYQPKTKTVNGNLVYSYKGLGGVYPNYGFGAERVYTWQQDGIYFNLRTNSKLYEKRYSLCDATKKDIKTQR